MATARSIQQHAHARHHIRAAVRWRRAHHHRYRAFLLPYIALAEAESVEMVSVNCELYVPGDLLSVLILCEMQQNDHGVCACVGVGDQADKVK